MKFYMKQKVMSFVDKFTIYDEQENEAYWVEGDFSLLAKSLTFLIKITTIKLIFTKKFYL